VATATVPTKIEKENVGLRQATAQATNTDMQILLKQLDLLDQGREPEALELGRQSGHQDIPTSVLEDANMRVALRNAAAQAQHDYPNLPEKQKEYMRLFLHGYRQSQQQGQTPNPQIAPLEVEGAPKPPEQAGGVHNFEIVQRQETGPDGKPVVRNYRFDKRTGNMEPIEGGGTFTRTGTGAGGGRESVFQQKQQAWLATHPNDAQGALDYASGRKALSEGEVTKAALTMAQREANANITLRFDQTKYQAFVQERATEIAAQLRSGLGAQPGGAEPVPARQPSPGAGDPKRTGRWAQPPGMGTREQPFQASVQDDVEWFKNNAQPGQVISINGELYTK
jgi:hypothetical protein